jgi:hypothetical protein
LAEVESLLGLPSRSAGPTDKPAASGWTQPAEKLFGQPIRGVSSNSIDPYLSIVREGMDQTLGMGMEQTVPGPEKRDLVAGLAEAHLELQRQLKQAGGAALTGETAPPFHFVTRRFGMGLIVALADDDPFTGGDFEKAWLLGGQHSLGDRGLPWGPGSLECSWLLNSIGARRFVWYQRHGLSAWQPNEDFWRFLIPGVGLAPVTAFRILITLFVLGIGPVNYLLLRRSKRLHLLVVTVPLSALAITLLLFGYAIVADGLGTRVRVRSFTQIDSRRGQAACWSRLSYYAGVAPFEGLRFPDEVAVIPLEYAPMDERTRERELIWEDDQWLASGWLASRTPAQYLTLRSRPTDLGLRIAPSKDSPGALRIENHLKTPIQQLVLRGRGDRYFWAADVPAGGTADARPIEPGDARRRLQRTFLGHEPEYPPGMEPAGLGRSSQWRGGRRRRGPGGPGDSVVPQQATGLLERSLALARSLNLRPQSYVAIVDRSPEVVLGTPAAREEAGLHVILGNWEP